MAQLNFQPNQDFVPPNLIQASHGTMSFLPINIFDSLSWATINVPFGCGDTAKSVSMFVGLYSLNVSTLSLANQVSRTFTVANASTGWVSATSTSAQNITPGTWWLGLVFNYSSSSNFSVNAKNQLSANNAFPGSFIGGRMTASTNALPSTVATSDLDITGSDGMNMPYIILSA